MTFCTKCGAELKPNAKFCIKCGNKINPEEKRVISRRDFTIVRDTSGEVEKRDVYIKNVTPDTIVDVWGELSRGSFDELKKFNQERYDSGEYSDKVEVKYEEVPLKIQTINSINIIRMQFKIAVEGHQDVDSLKENLLETLLLKSDEIISFIRNISKAEDGYELINLIGKPYYIQYNEDRIEHSELAEFLQQEEKLWTQLFPYDEIIIYLSEELKKKDGPPKQLYVKHTGGIRLKDIRDALDLLPLYGSDKKHPCYLALNYYYDYKGIPIYYCSVAFFSDDGSLQMSGPFGSFPTFK